MKSMILTLFLTATQALAEGAAAPAVPAGTPAGAADGAQGIQGLLASPLVPMALMFGVMYFLMIRPQQKKLKEQQEMLNKLKEGDDIVTSSGILGKIVSTPNATDKVITVEISDRVKVKMLKSQVSQVVKGGQVAELTQS